ncbi:hypothetical protein KCU81_g2205, partial [Aureobasidium melanogenum]|uniref:Uncharacterized protein n=1 Tax=Aureobasidium melanogenum (strain CBS 110374) TaxID=1043003 RepID=A0A074VXE8_AURM1
MTSVERVDEHSSQIKFNEDIFHKSTQETPSPLKIHAVHVEDRLIPETIDISPPPSPSPPLDNTPITRTSTDELESFDKAPVVDATEEQVPENQIQQKPPAIPPKSPLRGAKKINWLSRLLSKTVGRLSCFHGNNQKEVTKQDQNREARAGSTFCRGGTVGSGHPVITIPDLGGIADFGDIFEEFFANLADCGGDSSGCGGGDSADCGGGTGTALATDN